MVLASIGRRITPQEKITVPVTVFAMDEKIKSVQVSIKNNEIFKVVGNKTQTINFSSTGEKMAYFELEVLKSGLGKLEVSTTSGKHKASYKLEVDSINPNPISIETEDVILEPNTEQEIIVPEIQTVTDPVKKKSFAIPLIVVGFLFL